MRRGTRVVRRDAGSGDARRRGEAGVARGASLAPVVDDIVLLDPVCGMTVDREHARHLAEHDGVVYAFCSMGCRTAFIKEPGAYVPGPLATARPPRRRLTRPNRRPRCSSRAPSTIAAPRDAVWAFLMDPNQVGSCGPGVESIEVIDDDHFKAKAKVGIGFISAKFIRRHDGRRAERSRTSRSSRRTARRPGSAVDATANMALSGPAEGPTTMDWSADVLIAGTLASVGARLIEGTANKMIGQTFDCIRSKLEAG